MEEWIGKCPKMVFLTDRETKIIKKKDPILHIAWFINYHHWVLLNSLDQLKALKTNNQYMLFILILVSKMSLKREVLGYIIYYLILFLFFFFF